MHPDSEGFLYPMIDHNLCINCGLCEKVCPILQKEENIEHTQAYIIRNKDEAIVEESTSGGAFTAFAMSFLNKGAIVYGAGYDEDMRVVCKMATNPSELQEMRGSKFVQSDLGLIFSNIKKFVEQERQIVFTGTPCQLAGLLCFLQKKPDNLFCIDFICRGVPSPKLWQNYVKMMETKYKSKMVNARFRNKTYGYHSSTMKIDFENGKSYYGSGRVDPMMKAFVNELGSRPSCSNCAFKGVEHRSDITMFDCKEFSDIVGNPDDDKGYTSIFIHTEKGEKVFHSIEDQLTVYKVDKDSLITRNGIMVCNSAMAHPKREEFYRLAQTHSIDKAMSKISPITRMDYLIEGMKAFLFHTGLIKIARKLRKEIVIDIAK